METWIVHAQCYYTKHIGDLLMKKITQMQHPQDLGMCFEVPIYLTVPDATNMEF